MGETPDQCFEADEKTGNRYYQAFKRGYWALARQTFDKFKAHESLVSGISRETYPTLLIEIVSSVEWRILSGICGAGLQRRRASDPGLDAVLSQLMADSEGRPGIYMIELVDDAGLPPTVSSPFNPICPLFAHEFD